MAETKIRYQLACHDEEGWIKEYQNRGCLCIHDGNPKRPHSRLRSNKHSNGFFFSRPLIADEKLMRDVAHDLVAKLVASGFDLTTIDRVVGPQTGATKLAEFLAAEIGVCRGYPCAWASPKKHELPDKSITMVFDDLDHVVLNGERVIYCEDVVTTGGSIGRTDQAVALLGGIALPMLLAMVNRSGQEFVGNRPVIALVNRHLPTYDVLGGEVCPLCESGSEAISPKDNWARMVASY